MRDSTFYYQTLVRALMRGFAMVGFIVWLAISGAPHIPVSLRVLAVGVAFGFLYLTVALRWHYGGGRGVAVRVAGIYVRRWFRWRFIPWREISTFRIRRRSLSPPVFVELVSGESRMSPLTQGRQVAWAGGRSRDIVSVLKGDLALALRNAEPDPMGFQAD
jgi:hypothetical protein